MTEVPQGLVAHYRPDVFAARTDAEARAVILMPEDTTTEERWARETPWLAGAVVSAFELGPDHCVLDFGCGIGRLSRALIRRTGCRVLGVGISPGMLALAHDYVGSNRFSGCAPDALNRDRARADHACSI